MFDPQRLRLAAGALGALDVAKSRRYRRAEAQRLDSLLRGCGCADEVVAFAKGCLCGRTGRPLHRPVRQRRKLIDFRQRVERRRVVAFTDIARYAPADLGTLAIAMIVRYAETRRNLAHRPLLQALLRYDRMLTRSALFSPGSDVRVAAVHRPETNQFVHALQRRALVNPAQAGSAQILEDVPDQWIRAQDVRLVQVTKKMLDGYIEAGT
jgi:hypothetical protein